MLNKMRLLALPMLIISLVVALAPAASALPGPGTDGKKAEVSATSFQAAAVPTVFTAGRIYKDHNLGGGVLQTFTANDGACDTAGYRFNLYLSSANTQGSSVQMHALAGSRCNYVKIIAKTYNGVTKTWGTCNRGQVINFGPEYNDRSAAVEYKNSNLCSPV